MLPEYREIEKKVTDIRDEMQRVLALSDDELPAADRRDRVMKMTGQVEELEAKARELRDHEIEELRKAVEGGSAVGGDASAGTEQMDAYCAWLTRGEVRAAALTTSPDSQGGYLMPFPLRAALVDKVRDVNPIFAAATVFNLSDPGTFKVELPRKTAVTNGGWVGETDARPATNAPTFGSQTLECFGWYANPEVTQKSLDAIEGAEQLVLDDIADTWAEVTGEAYAIGDGDEKPSGVFAATSFYTAKISSTSNSLDAAQFLTTYFALPAKYLPTAAWWMKPATLATIAALAWPNLSDTPLVKFNENTGEATILGKKVMLTDDAPAIGDGLYPALFGDMRRGYAVGTHSQVTTLRDPYTNKPYVGFYTTGYSGGCPWDPQAILLMKSDNS